VATSRKPGSLPWGTWYFGGLDLVTGEDSSTRELARLMETAPDRAAVARTANDLVTRLDARLVDLQRAADADSRSRPYDGLHLAGRFTVTADHALTPDGRRFRDPDWDGVTQHYLGAAAYYYAWGSVDPRGRDARVRSPLGLLGGHLTFPKGYNSPRGADPGRLLDLFRQLHPDRHP
jgi:hypothetical protein